MEKLQALPFGGRVFRGHNGKPKSIMRLAAEVGVIRRVDAWMHYINACQNTSHDYSEADCVLAIVDEFYPDVINLYQTLSGKGWNIESKP